MKYKIISLFLLLVFFGLLFKPFENKIFWIGFADENDNILLGKWIETKKIYQDIFYNHQPYPFIVSFLIQKVSRPSNLFLLVKRHREFIFIFSFLFSVYLVYKIGFWGLLISIFYESSKHLYLGQLFLAESLVVYPLILSLVIFWDLINNKKISYIDLVVLPLLIFFVCFSLIPLVFFCLALFIGAFLLLSKNKRIIFLLITLSQFLCMFLLYVPFSFFWQDTIMTNLVDFIPNQAGQNLSLYLLHAFLKPVTSLFINDIPISYKLISILYLVTLFGLVILKKYKTGILFYIALLLVNLRPIEKGQIYQGFHLLPYLGILVAVAALQTRELYGLLRRKNNIALGFIIISLALVSFCSIWELSSHYMKKNNRDTDFYVNYSPFYTYGDIINILKTPQHTFFSFPQYSLVYWQADIYSNYRYFFVLDFMRKSNRIRNDLENHLLSNPPDFFYTESQEDLMMFGENLDKYMILYRYGKPTPLYMKKTLAENIAQDKKEIVLEKHGVSY